MCVVWLLVIYFWVNVTDLIRVGHNSLNGCLADAVEHYAILVTDPVKFIIELEILEGKKCICFKLVI